MPDQELRALLTLLRAARKTASAAARRAIAGPPHRRSRPAAPNGREALLAGTLLQLGPGDLLITSPGDASSTSVLLAASTAGSRSTGKGSDMDVGRPDLPPDASPSLSAAAMAAALKATRGDRLVLALTDTNQRDAAWPEAMAWAQEQRLPLVLACADPSGGKTFQSRPGSRSGSLDWTALAKVAHRIGFPVLTVDGEDAVAVYRVMQESVLRARAGGGPALLWAMLPRASDLRHGARPASFTPVSRLQRYLRTRRIAL